MRDGCVRRLAAFACGVLVCGAVASEPSSQLVRLSRALREVDYQGSLVYQHEGRTESLRLFHAAGSPERERLVSLSGALREVVRADGQLLCRQGGAGAPLLSLGSEGSLLPLAPRLRAGDPGPDYRLVERGEDRVAGYVAQVIELQACDEYRYGYRLWLERDSGLLLRAVLLGPGESPLEQMMFVHLEIGARPADVDLRLGGATDPPARSAAAETAFAGREGWRFSALPRGFRIDSRLVAPGEAGGEHLLLTDGVATVSVYVEPSAAGAFGSPGVATRGALSLFSRNLAAHRVLVLGTVPARTVESIALALERAEP